jgi:hypothetical protein
MAIQNTMDAFVLNNTTHTTISAENMYADGLGGNKFIFYKMNSDTKYNEYTNCNNNKQYIVMQTDYRDYK